MRKNSITIRLVFLLLGIMVISPLFSAAIFEGQDGTDADKLLVVWTSGDRDVALKMVYMYTFNAKKRGWWGTIRFLVWGPSAKLLANDAELQQEVIKMKEIGIELLACKACADSYNVSEKLTELGLDVKYMGVPLTEMLKSGWTTITF